MDSVGFKFSFIWKTGFNFKEMKLIKFLKSNVNISDRLFSMTLTFYLWFKCKMY